MSDNVKVAVRVRPFNQREKDREAKCIIKMENASTLITNPEDSTDKTFTFDYSYNSFVERNDPQYASQDTVWKDIGIGVLENAFEGYNCSLFAYGQTGSGKSYSMMGYGVDRGIIPIACERIFDRMKMNKDPDLTIRVEASMMEIYMEHIHDLFNPGAGELKIRNDVKKGFFVEGITKNAVADYESISKLMDAGSKARTVASTQMNATSSRAHTIFQIVLTQTKIDRAAGTAKDKVALINLIDLAGSERANSTGATGDRLKEGSAINLSLSCLGNVISALAQNSDPNLKKKVRVPYRDSVLTMLLQNSLGGNARTIMIAAISPADINYDETLSTLRYADRAKQIKNKAVINEDPNEKLIRGLRDEIETLRKQLLAAAQGSLDPSALGALGGGGGIDTEAERQRIRAEMEAERDREMQRMREELETKLKMEMEEGKSWEERLAETKARAAQRDRELAEMGVLVGADREAQLEKAKTIPHLSNVNEDPMLSGQLLSFLEPGKDITIGRKDAAVPKDVKLGGLSIMENHAVIRQDGDKIVIEPTTPGAKIMVNGNAVTGTVELHHLHRIVFGASHAYLFINPAEAAAGRAAEGENVPEVIDYQFIIYETNKSQMKAMAEEEAKRRAEAEEERRKADARVAEIEAKMRSEREASEREVQQKLREYEERAQQQAGNEELVKKLKEEQARIAADAKAKQEELERRLQAQVEETNKLHKKKDKERREKTILDEKLLKVIPFANEANAISEEVGKNMTFEPKLMANQHKVPLSELRAIYGEDAAIPEQLDTEVYIRVDYKDGSMPQAMWHYDKFMNRLYIMREMYQYWSEHKHSLAGSEFVDQEKDPFYDPVEETMIGKAIIYLDSLQYVLPIEETTPIIDYKGTEQGELQVRIVPHAADKEPKLTPGDDDDDDGDLADKIEDLKGKKLGITFFIDSARGLPPNLSHSTYVKFSFYLESTPAKTPETGKKSINPKFGWHKTFKPVVTDDFIKFVGTDSVEFQVWGKPQAAAPAPAQAPEPVSQLETTHPTTTTPAPVPPAAQTTVAASVPPAVSPRPATNAAAPAAVSPRPVTNAAAPAAVSPRPVTNAAAAAPAATTPQSITTPSPASPQQAAPTPAPAPAPSSPTIPAAPVVAPASPVAAKHPESARVVPINVPTEPTPAPSTSAPPDPAAASAQPAKRVFSKNTVVPAGASSTSADGKEKKCVVM